MTSKRDPPFMISFTYVNADSTRWFQRELHSELHPGPYQPAIARNVSARAQTTSPDTVRAASSTSSSPTTNGETDTSPVDAGGFTIIFPSGSFSWSGPQIDLITWDIQHSDFSFIACTTSSRVAWTPGDAFSTPAGPLANLPLPIQWHVHSLDSECAFSLSIDLERSKSMVRDRSDEARVSSNAQDGTTGNSDAGELAVHPLDAHGVGRVHTEKNWAYSFPASYIWIQARNPSSEPDDTITGADSTSSPRRSSGSGICIAGGSLFQGVQAYLIGYHPSTSRPISFAPPTSTSLFGLSLGTTTRIAYSAESSSTCEITVNGWYTRLLVTATAEPGTFFPLSAPLKTGHRAGYTVQSFAARITVRRWSRATLWGAWREEKGDEWENGSLEFGGDLYKAHTE